MQQLKNARSRESGVSEIIGAVLLIALVVAAIAIIGVGLTSQPLPKKIPALDAVISTSGNIVQITHNGGDTLQKADMVILVDGVDRTASFSKAGGDTSWQSLAPGESLTINNANPDSVRIVYKSADATALLSSATFGQAGNVTAQFIITASAGNGGTISPTGSVPAVYGDLWTFTITPNSGYHIIDVRVDGNSVGAVSSYIVGPATKDYTITATFALNTYTITPSAGTGGVINPGTVQDVIEGGSQSFSITPDPSYHITDVLVDGVSQGVISSYSFTNVHTSHTILATFAINTYTINATAGANGAISPSGSVSVNSGAGQTFSIVPNAGYYVAGILVDGVSSGTNSSYTFTNVAANHTISSSFAINQYTITPSAGAGGVINPGTSQTLNFGGSQGFTIIPNANYHIANVTVDGISVGTPSSYNFTNVQASHLLNASFALNTYSITPSVVGGNGMVSPSTVQSVNYGATPTFTFTPASGYHLNTVTVNGTTVTPSGNIYTFPAVTTDKTITVTFAINTYTITATNDTFGSVTPAGVTTVNYGATPTYTITPNNGYHVADVLVNGTSVGAVTSYLFPAVATDKTISATFALNTYTITATNDTFGSVTPAGVTTVNYGATPTYTITPNSGYHVEDVLVNGTSVGAVTSYLFPAVTTDKTIAATFAINTYTITATNDTFGSVTPAGVTTVNYGATPTYTITPNVGYHVANVLVNGTSVGAVTSYLFPAVTTNKTIAATFALNTYTITASISGGNGNVTPVNQTVNYGATPSVTFAPDTGYHLDTVTVNGTPVTTTGNSYTFPPVTTDKALVGTFMVDPPVAGFTGSPRSGAVPLVIAFNDTSTNNPTSWLWNFGDGQISTLRNPTNTYSLAGNYSVSLTVTNAGGSNSTTKDGYIFSYISAVANFTGTPTSGPASLNTFFTDLSTGSPSSWYWQFGDISLVNTSTSQNPGHTYESVGIYSVNLTVANSYSSSSLLRPAYINVTTTPPVAHILANRTSGVAPLTVLFRDLSTNTPTSWLWHFDDGTADVTTKDATHTFANPGSYNVSHTATNAGGSSVAYQIITVTGLTINATAGANGAVTPAGETIVNYGATPTYTITPNSGYHVVDVLVNGTSVGPVPIYTFPPVTTNQTISATFTINTYTITASVDAGNGIISPAGVTTVNYGATPTYTITKNATYHIQDVLVNGTSVGAVASYVFPSVTTNKTIIASFAKNPSQQIYYQPFTTTTGWPYDSYYRSNTAVVLSSTIRNGSAGRSVRDQRTYNFGRTISTAGYEDIIVRFAWASSGVSSTEYSQALYTVDGTNFVPFARLTGPQASLSIVTNSTLPAGNDAQFGLRWQVYGNGNSDYLYVDDVQVFGTPI